MSQAGKLEAMTETKVYKNDFADRHETVGMSEALVTVLGARNIELSAQQHELVESCRDRDQFNTWLKRAGTASSADDVFKD